MSFSERIQVLLDPAQNASVERAARARGMSKGALIREAVDRHLQIGNRSPQEALNRLRTLDAPVADWDQMKAEILAGQQR